MQLADPVTKRMRGQGGVPGKVERATPLLTKLEQGEVFLPLANATWLVELEQEFLSWTGLNDEPADQIDAAAYAAIYAKHGTFAVGVSSSSTSSWPWSVRGIPGLWKPGQTIYW
jgi:hypothetical protein